MCILEALAILLFVCVIGLAVYLYSPVPDGVSQPWKVRFFLALNKAFILMARIITVVGLEETNIKAQRRLFNKMAAKRVTSKSDPLLQVTDTIFDGVAVRVYRPKAARTPCPALVFLHGGGWTLGSPDMYDSYVSEVAKSANIVVVSVDYRLSPEHPFPMPFDDCVTATLHLLKKIETYEVDKDKIAVGGDSAGGNLAAAVSLYLRDNPQLPNISLQILMYPCIQPLNFKTPSYVNTRNHALLTPVMMAQFWANYIGPTSHSTVPPKTLLNNQHTSSAIKKSHYAEFVNASLNMPKEFLGKQETENLDNGNETLWKEIETRVLNPYMSPLLAKDVSNLPPAIVVTAEYDVLRDEGIMYAERLRKAGVKVKHRNYKMLHGFAVIPRMFEISRTATHDLVSDIKEHFALN